MSWVNHYRPPHRAALADPYGPQPYDINFPFPINVASLENGLVQLTPFVPRIHAAAFWDQLFPALDDLLHFLPWKFSSFDDFLNHLEDYRANPQSTIFAVVDKTKPAELGLAGALAGMIGLLETSAENRATEIGPIFTLPKYQRTFVTTNAVGLLLRFCLSTPSAAPPGLGLRRVEFTSNPRNQRSVVLAKRMGFREEGTCRWSHVLSTGKEGNEPGEEDPIQLLGRDSEVFSMCWDDWESGVREHVDRSMKPR